MSAKGKGKGKGGVYLAQGGPGGIRLTREVEVR